MKSLMYAVIATGGKQEKVETGQVLNVELLGADEGSEITFNPILLVDDETVMSTTDELSGASVSLAWLERPRVTRSAASPTKTKPTIAADGDIDSVIRP